MYTQVEKSKENRNIKPSVALKKSGGGKYGINFFEYRGNRSSDETIQKYTYQLGGLNNDSGELVKTGLILKHDTGGGSSVSAWPNWWPSGPAETANDFLQTNFVQGHLLNEKLGGPGNDRKNLTPLTRSANSQMSASIESVAKAYLEVGYGITYEVKAHYDKHPTISGVGANHLNINEQNKLQQALDKMPYWISAEITVYEQKQPHGNYTPTSKQPDILWVANESKDLKGTYS